MFLVRKIFTHLNKKTQKTSHLPKNSTTEDVYFVTTENGLTLTLYRLEDPLMKNVVEACNRVRFPQLDPKACCVADVLIADEHIYLVYRTITNASWLIESMEKSLSSNFIAVEYYVYREHAFSNGSKTAKLLEHAILEKEQPSLAILLYS